MKSLLVKLGVVLLTIFFFVIGCQTPVKKDEYSKGADWKMVCEYDEGIMFYAADKVIVSSKDTVRVWTRLRYNSAFVSKMVKKYGHEFIGAAYSEKLIDISCAEQKIMFADSYVFSYKSELLMHTPSNSEWMFTPPGSPMEYLYKEVCPLPELREGIEH